MKIKLACADFSFPMLPHEDALQLIAMLKFEGVDIGLFEGRSHRRPSHEFADLESRARELRRCLNDRGLTAADVFLQMDADFAAWAINHPDKGPRQKARDWFDRTLTYAGCLDCRHVTVLPGVAFEQEASTDSWGRATEELAWRVAKSQEMQIVFGTEAHVGSIASTPEDALRLVAAVPGLTLTLDYTHFTRLGIPDSRVELLIRHAGHFHVRGARQNRLQVNFTENTIDYARVLEVMQETNYGGWIGIEYVWIDWEGCNQSDNLSETIRFRDYISESSKRLGRLP